MKKTFTLFMCALLISNTQGTPCTKLDPNALNTLAQKSTPWPGWWITTGLGISCKPEGESTPPIGFLGTCGMKWCKTFKKKWFFSPVLFWAILLPEMIHNKGLTVLFFKKKVPINLATLVPVTFLQVGYITDTQVCLAIGMVYICAVDFSVSAPLSKRCALTIKWSVFMDKLLSDQGIHTSFLTVGIDWKMKNNS